MAVMITPDAFVVIVDAALDKLYQPGDGRPGMDARRCRQSHQSPITATASTLSLFGSPSRSCFSSSISSFDSVPSTMPCVSSLIRSTTFFDGSGPSWTGAGMIDGVLRCLLGSLIEGVIYDMAKVDWQ